MVKIQKISEIEPRLGFTEFDMLKKYRQSFATSELGRLHALFPFSELARQMHLKSSALGRKSYFSPEGKIALMVLKSYTNFSDAQLIEHLNGNIHYQLFCGVQNFSPEGKIALMVLKSYTNFSDAQLIEHLNGNIHYQLFCGVQIDPLHPLTNPKIVSAIRQELANRLDVESLQLILAEHWKPYLENLHVCMTDATCYESHLRFPTDTKLLWEGIVWLHRHLCKHCHWKPYLENLHVCMTDATCYESHLRFPTDTKLLWEGIVWLHRHLCKHCQTLHIQRPRNKYLDVRRAYLAYSKLLHIQRPRNKYLDVRRAYLAYSKLRKRRKSQTRMITRRLLQLLEKLLDQLEQLHSSYRNRLALSSDYQRRFSVIQTVLEQGKNLFAGKHYPLITKDVSRSYRQSLSKGRIYLQAKKCPTVS